MQRPTELMPRTVILMLMLNAVPTKLLQLCDLRIRMMHHVMVRMQMTITPHNYDWRHLRQ